MTLSHGFELQRDEEIAETNTRARLWRHVQTGAELLSLENSDENKVFGITFRTPPADSTGIAHIMEHSVLGGSRKYQVKEPFVELLKGSLYTFLNAMTYPEKTVYPVASTNAQDFYNLVDVYLDAVLHPLITPHHLEQEGWHYELDGPDAPLTYKGVVFNEMKGVYSSPDSLLYRLSQQILFPENSYGYDSGGKPEAIPDLTYAQFKAFHETFYHPSNALIFFYGDDDPETRLRLLDGYLRDFEAQQVDAAVPVHPPFDAPQRVTAPYSVNADQHNGQTPKALVQMNWVLPEYDDPALAMALDILSYALVSTPASPLRKALIDSGLGEDTTGYGLMAYTRQMTFSVGLKGVAAENAARVEALIVETLRTLADEGLEPEMVEAAVNSIEFSLRENNTGSYPRGIALLTRALNTWLHGRDPLMPLRYEAPLTAVKASLAADPAYLQNLLRVHLLDNPHRASLILEPDPELAQRQETAEKERLAAARAALEPADLQAIMHNAAALRRRQEAPDDPAALAALPRLTLADLDKESKTIPLALSEPLDSRVLYHDLFTNGILYLDVGLNLRALPQRLLPYARLFGQALLEMGTETEDFVRLSQRIGSKTGGIEPSTFTAAVRASDDAATWLFLRGKSTVAQTPDLLAILRDVLLTARLDNRERFRQIVLEAKAGKEGGLIPGGHMVVNTRLRARYNLAGWAAEQMGGVENLFFLRRLAEQIEQDWPSVLADLEAVRRHLLTRQAMIFNVTLDAGNWAAVAPQLHGFIAALPAAPPAWQPWTPRQAPANEGLTIPAQVNYVAKGANLYDLGYQLHGSMAVILKYLRTTWLWEKIRVQGGAYGAMVAFDKHSGVLSYLSYRDPNLLQTVANYDQTAAFLRDNALSADELTKSIIGAIGAIDGYQLPDAKGYTSMVRHLVGETDAARQQYRDELLATTAADFRALAGVLERLNAAGSVAALGSAEAIRRANGDAPWLEVTPVM